MSCFVIALSFAAACTVLTSCLVHEQKCTLTGHSRLGVLGGVLARRQAHRQRVGDKTVKVWDSQTGKEVNVLFCHRPIVCSCVH